MNGVVGVTTPSIVICQLIIDGFSGKCDGIHIMLYHVLLSKRLWALTRRSKMGDGRLHGDQKWGWALTWKNRVTIFLGLKPVLR